LAHVPKPWLTIPIRPRNCLTLQKRVATSDKIACAKRGCADLQFAVWERGSRVVLVVLGKAAKMLRASAQVSNVEEYLQATEGNKVETCRVNRGQQPSSVSLCL